MRPLFLFSMLLLCISCSSHNTLKPIEQAKIAENKESILIAADPQFHNIYGIGLKQMSIFSDKVSKVAIRPPELNILAPLLFNELINQVYSENKPIATVILGDVTNISCSIEFDIFEKTIINSNLNDKPVFLAHGNHDSYMMGTVNSYYPSDSSLSDFERSNIAQIYNSNMPIDSSWWNTDYPVINDNIFSFMYRNWKDACFKVSSSGNSTSYPLNKSIWLAKYIKNLTKDKNIKFKSEKVKEEKYKLSSPFTHLFKNNDLMFESAGYWYPPFFNGDISQFNYNRVYQSFLVQKLITKNATIIIIDTSVCKRISRVDLALNKSAGTQSCIGDEQFNIIDEFLAEVNVDSKLIIASHFPLKDLSKTESKTLFNALQKFNDWSYISAHTHYPSNSVEVLNHIDYNFASTTDWPNQINLLSTLSKDNELNIKTFSLNLDAMAFSYDGKIDQTSEICRHYPIIKKLYDAIQEFKNGADSMSYETWVSQSNYSSCDTNSFKENSSRNMFNKVKEMEKWISDIYIYSNENHEYKKFLIRIALGASEYERKQDDLISGF